MNYTRYAYFLLLPLAAGVLILAQEKEQEIKEFVQVINVEMVVRVMEKGKPVGGLQKQDFNLLEDGQKREINGFIEVRRRIAPKPITETVTPTRPQKPGRLFLLFFWINELGVDTDAALDYFFRDIYGENDRVILASAGKSLEINNPADKSTVLERFKRELLDQGRSTQNERTRTVRYLQEIFDEYMFIMQNVSDNRNPNLPVNARRTLVQKYVNLLKEFRLQNMTPHPSHLERLANSLETIEADKWALVFYQRDAMPVFNISRLLEYAAQMGIQREDLVALQKEFDRSQFETEFIKDINGLGDFLRTRFIQANALFHLLMLDSRKPSIIDNADTHIPLARLTTFFSNWEAVMRDITQITGGQVMDGNRLQEALSLAANFEDIYYIITYVPGQSEKRQRLINIQVSRPGLNVIFGRRLEMEKLPEIQLKEADFINGTLQLRLENIYLLHTGGTSVGHVAVTVYGITEKGKGESILLEKEFETNGNIQIPLTTEKTGKHLLYIKVQDRLTGHESSGQLETEIAAPVSAESKPLISPELASILEKAAAYCEKLKKTAFHFICSEDLAEDILDRQPGMARSVHYKRTTWLYDYQIVSFKGTIKEKRILLRRNRKKLYQENAGLENRFHSLYSFYLPATLLGSDKQARYIYQLEGHEKLKKKSVAHLSISPMDKSSTITAGEAWIDPENGAIIKIRLDQRSIKGIEELEKQAQRSGARLQVTDIHWYEVEENGILFPSETNIFEYYITEFKKADTKGAFTYLSDSSYAVSRGTNQIEYSRTYIHYRDYRFFTVQVQVEDKMEPPH